VCTENSILIDYVTEASNVSGDDRSVMLLPDPVHLAVQVEEASERSSENEQCNSTHHDWIKGGVGLRRRDVHRRALSIPTTSMSHASTNSLVTPNEALGRRGRALLLCLLCAEAGWLVLVNAWLRLERAYLKLRLFLRV
jgi:hypothetical protein